MNAPTMTENSAMAKRAGRRNCAPADWREKRLRFALSLNPSWREAARLKDEDEVSFVPMEAVGEFGGLDLSSAKPIGDVGSGYTFFAEGDVIVAKITPCFENGKGALARHLRNGVAFGTTELHVLRANPVELCPEYLFYLSISQPFRAIGESSMYGAGGQKRVPEEFVKNFRWPLPPLSEQRAIAAFLDRETARIDALIEKKRRLIELLQEKRAAVVTRAVTHGLAADSPKRDSGEIWLGAIPAHWAMRRLKYLVSVRGGMTPDRGNLEYWDGSIPWITAKDMKVLTVIDSEDRISDSALLETGLKTIEPPAVLLVVRGMILAHTLPVAEVGGRLTVNQDMKALIPRLTVDCGYLAWLLRGLSRHLLALVDDAAHGTKALRSESLFNTFLPVPPMDEQRAIASYLAERTEALDRCVSAARAAIDRLTEYRSALIAAAVTGQIDVREAA